MESISWNHKIRRMNSEEIFDEYSIVYKKYCQNDMSLEEYLEKYSMLNKQYIELTGNKIPKLAN